MSWTPPSMIPASRLGLNLAPVFGWRGSYAEDRWLGTSRELCRLCLCLAAYLSALPGGSSPGLLPTWSSAFPLLCARLTRLMTLCPALCLTGWRPAPAAPSPTFHLRPLALLLGPDTPQPKEPFLPAAAQVANRPPVPMGQAPAGMLPPASILRCLLPFAWSPRVCLTFGPASSPHRSLVVPKQVIPWPAPPLGVPGPAHPISPQVSSWFGSCHPGLWLFPSLLIPTSHLPPPEPRLLVDPGRVS